MTDLHAPSDIRAPFVADIRAPLGIRAPFEEAMENPVAKRTCERLLATERMPDLLEVATLEAARRQVRQIRQMSGRDRDVRPTNHRTAGRQEIAC